ncbi:MAG: site-specific integrase, partial [Saprospiraceae bacterium]|nr:site-specific integrase [Saprospiraceae bacterium]
FLIGSKKWTMGRHKKSLSESEIVLYPADRKLTTRWYVEFYNPQKNRIDRMWIGARFVTEKERLGEFDRIKTELLETGIAPKALPTDNFQPDLAASKRLNSAFTERNHLKKKSKSSYKSKLKMFDDFCKARHYTAITETVAHAYLHHRVETGRAVSTINGDRRILKSFVKSVPYSSNTIKKNAFDKTRKLRGGGEAGREYYKPAQKAQIKTFFQQHYPALWFACKFVYFCYVRNGNELIHLKISDLDLHLNRLRIGASHSKNGYTESVVIPKSFAVELAKMDYSQYPQDWYLVGPDGVPSETCVSVDYWGKLHKKALDKMGFDKGGKRYSMYSWKNTGVVDSYLARIGIKDLQGQLRHKNLQTTYLYLKCLGLFDNADTFDVIKEL